MIDRNALTVIQGDARISCRHLQEVLGFNRVNDVHRLIRAHEDELNDYGGVFAQDSKNPSAKGGRPITTYYLNEHQATAVCLWAETPKARAARRLIIEVFTAWRKGQLAELPAPKADPFAAMAGRVQHVADHLMAIDSLDDFALRLTHLPVWKNGRRPDWWSNIDLRRFLTVSHRQMTLQDCRDKAVQSFGVGAPSLSAIQRFWSQLDRAVGPAPDIPRPQAPKKERAA